MRRSSQYASMARRLMPWLKLLHIGAVIVWCGALLYLPALVAAAAGSRSTGTGTATAIGGTRLRGFYTLVATSAALVAITTGTWLFATRGPLAPWLMVKLALVGLLVLGHGACGMLVLRSERGETNWLGMAGRVVTVSTLLCLAGIAGLVLGKPGWP